MSLRPQVSLQLQAGDPPVERAISPGEVARFRIRLAANSFVHVYVNQIGIDLVASLLDPTGRTIVVADGPGGPRGGELLAAVVSQTGTYEIHVAAPSDGTTGRFRLRINDVRPARDGDGERAVAMRLYVEGLQSVDESSTPRELRASVARLQAASDGFRRIGDEQLLGWTLLRLAGAQLFLEAPDAALAPSAEAVGLLEQAGDTAGMAAASLNLAQAQAGIGSYEAALETYQRALDEFSQADDQRGIALTLNNRGKLFGQIGDWHHAKADFENALGLWQRLQATERVVVTTINLGVAHRELGEYEQALYRYEQGAALARTTNSKYHELHLLSNLGRYYIGLGRLQEALDTLNRARDLTHTLEKKELEWAVDSHLGLLHLILGQPEVALQAYQRAVDLSRDLGNDGLVAQSVLALGRAYRESGQIERGSGLLHEALGIASSNDLPLVEAKAQREIGLALLASGDGAAALSSIRRAVTLTATASPFVRSEMLRSQATVEERLGDLEAARHDLQRAVDLGLGLEDPLGHGAALAQLASIERKRGDLESAQAHLEETLDLHEGIRGQLVAPELRASFLSSWRQHYSDLISVLMERAAADPGKGFAQLALSVSERSRARVLTELLSEAKVEIRTKIDPELRLKERALRDRLSLLYSELIEPSSEGVTPSDRDLRRDLETTRQSYRTLELEIRRHYASYAELRYPRPLAAEDVVRLVPEGTALLEYVPGETQSFLFVVRSAGLTYHRLPPFAEIRRNIATFRELIRRGDARSARQLAAVESSLFDQLLAPAMEELETVRQLWIVPDNDLLYLPFEALRLKDAVRGPHYLIDRWSVGYAPSATVLANLPPYAQDAGALHFVAFADPVGGGLTDSEPASTGVRSSTALRQLPGTLREVEEIAALFPDSSQLYLGPDANQGNVEDNPLVSRARWLHFASHALIRERDPTNSSILLSPDERGDFLLQVFEIFNLDLHAEAVVLSACETGLGGSLDGEGLVGLSRAFFYAGTESVVMSLWPVEDDATAELMHRFYAHAADGASLVDALRIAKREMLTETPFVNPRYWAPFILHGRIAARGGSRRGRVACPARPATRRAQGGCGASAASLVVDDDPASTPPRSLHLHRKTPARDPDDTTGC